MSKWAEKLLKTSKKWFKTPDQQASASAAPAAAAAAPPSLPPAGASSGLIDASAASRAAAMGQTQSKVGPSGESGDATGGGGGGGGCGQGGMAAVDPAERAHSYDAGSVLALSELLGVLLRRWGTGANASNQVMQVTERRAASACFVRREGWRWRRGRGPARSLSLARSVCLAFRRGCFFSGCPRCRGM